MVYLDNEGYSTSTQYVSTYSETTQRDLILGVFGGVYADVYVDDLAIWDFELSTSQILDILG